MPELQAVGAAMAGQFCDEARRAHRAALWDGPADQMTFDFAV